MFIERMNKGSWGKIRAFFDVQTQEGFTLKGFKFVEGNKGMFVGFPSQKGHDGVWQDTVWVERDVRELLTDLANTVYSSDAGVKSQDNFIERKQKPQDSPKEEPLF